MLKLTGMLLLIAAGALTGFNKAAALTKRVRFFEDYISFITQIETQIRYSSQTLCVLLEDARAPKALEPLIECFISRIESGEDFDKTWESAAQQIPADSGISKQDRELVKRFGTGLGKTDMQGQESHCELCLREAICALEEARRDRDAKSKLYRSLGILSGAACALLIL